MKKIYLLAGIALALLLAAYQAVRIPPLSSRHGQVDTHLYLSEGPRQPLVVAFGGGSGGNDWERRYLKGHRDSLLAKGFAVLAIGYFKTTHSPDALDRISLNAITDTIFSICGRYPQLDSGRVVLLGASKGAELVLNLASRFPNFKAVVALSPSHVSFPALTVAANTSSWQYDGEEVPYVPAPFGTIVPAIKGDLYGAFSMMLENDSAVEHSEIAVERINGPILILSAAKDDQWPSAYMGEQIVRRLVRKKFMHHYEHIALDGGHAGPLNHMDKVVEFLETAFNTLK